VIAWTGLIVVGFTCNRAVSGVKIMQVFVKLSKFFRQITTKTGNFRQM
jgi:hypothetical protein